MLGEGAVGMAHKEFQKGILPGHQLQGRAAFRDGMGGTIEAEVTNFQPR